MPRSTVFKADGTKAGELPSVAEEPGFTPRVTIEKVGDGAGFYTATVLPHGFDPAKKYPVIVDVYGGPGHDVARLTHRIIRFRSDYQSECLQIRGYVELAAMVVAHQYFAEVLCTTFRRNRPQNVGEIFTAESCGPLEIGEFHLDLEVAFLTFNLGLPAGGRHEIRSRKVQFRSPAAMLVIDRLHTAADHRDVECRRRRQWFKSGGGLSIRLR